MRGHDLLKDMELIDEALIEEAMDIKVRRKAFRMSHISALAACLVFCLILGYFVTWRAGNGKGLDNSESNMSPGAAMDMESIETTEPADDAQAEESGGGQESEPMIIRGFTVSEESTDNTNGYYGAELQVGSSVFSKELQAAITHYQGEDVLYVVTVRFHEDNLNIQESEVERLQELGYDIKVQDGKIVLTLTEEQLMNFPKEETIGYYFDFAE